MDAKSLMAAVADDESRMVDSLVAMLRIKAVGPENEGEGEAERGKYIVHLARKLGFKSIEVLESPDPKVPTGKRPNIIVRVKGRNRKNIWVVAHIDTVPEGDLSLWKYPPFEPRVVKGKIHGRGSEDNGQELIASLFGLKALVDSRLVPECNINLLYVSDEEHGNVHGIDFVLAQKGLVKKGDLVVVPDHGEVDGLTICVVEKGIAWIAVEVIGRQTHASTPDSGINAFEVAARFMTDGVDTLRKKFSLRDRLFSPPQSTFEATKSDANVPNVNTIPGRQTFTFDFRVLPEYDLGKTMGVLEKVANKWEKKTGAKIHLSFLQRTDAAPRTPKDSEIVKRLSKALLIARGKNPRLEGIGGGTCAAPFRRKGIAAAVWSTIPGNAHDANEYANIADLVADAQVYAILFAGSSIED